MAKIKAAKTTKAPKLIKQGKLRWSIELKNGDIMDKYNEDGTKNRYAGREDNAVKVYAPVSQATTIGLTDENGALFAVMDVPDGAKAFQRRRVRDIPYHGKFADATKKVGGVLMGNRWIPERTLTKKVPIYDYGQCWIIGWRTPSEVKYKVVFEDGRVDEYTEWDTTPWTYEPEWFPDEQV